MTTSRGPFPPINVFQQDGNILAIMELPGVGKNDLQIQAKANTIRIFGKKNVGYSDYASVHRRERVSGKFDRTLSLPVEIDPNGIKLSTVTAFSPRSCPGPKATSRTASRK